MQRGTSHSEESRKKISAAMKGHVKSEETKRKISRAMSGANHPLFGKQVAPETRRKMVDSQRMRRAREA